MRGDQVCVYAEPKYSQPVDKVVLPYRAIPRRRTTLENLGTPDVVDEDVDRAVFALNPITKSLHRSDIEMVDLNRDSFAAELSDQISGLLDCFGTVVVGLRISG